LRIVIAEYPKSGGTWIVSVIGDALGLPKRDIYVNDEYKSFDVRKHPWYRDASELDLPDACVIKSHELPDSALHEFPKRMVHLVRDGRDVVVSKFFFERDFCVANGVYSKFDEKFDDYVPRVAAEWNRYVLAWLNCGVPIVRYEEFLTAPVAAAQCLLSFAGKIAPEEVLQEALSGNTKEKLHASLSPAFVHNTFVRKGVAGDWRNHFCDRHIAAFDSAAGEAMEALGYSR
jgi:Sulfotransferase domain